MAQFEETKRMATAVNQVVGAMLTRKRGDILYHEAIERLTGFHRDDWEYRHVMKRAYKKMLKPENGGIEIMGVASVGYKLLTIGEQLHEMPRRRERRASRQYLKKQKSLESLPTAAMDDHSRRVRLSQIEQAKSQRSVLRKQMRENAAVFKTTETLPRMRIAG